MSGSESLVIDVTLLPQRKDPPTFKCLRDLFYPPIAVTSRQNPRLALL